MYNEYKEAKKLAEDRVSKRREYEPQIEENEYIGEYTYVNKERKKKTENRLTRINQYNIPVKTSVLDAQNEEVRRQETLSNKDKKKARTKIMNEESELLNEKAQESVENIQAHTNEEALIREIRKLKINQDIFEKFTPTYIGEHFKEVRKMMDTIEAFSKLIEENENIYNMVKHQEIITFDFIDFKEKCLTAFNTSLMIHGLHYGEDGQLCKIPEYEDSIKTSHLGGRLGEELNAIINVFKNAEYDKEKNIVLNTSNQVFDNEEMYDTLSETLEENETIVAIRNRIEQNDESIREPKELINKLIADYERFETLILLETERIRRIEAEQDRVIEANRNYDLEYHFENELFRLQKRIADMGEDKKEIIDILKKINTGEELEEHQKDYLATFYDKRYEMVEEPQQEVANRTTEELRQDVDAMCERLYSCRTKKDFLNIRRDVCRLASELEQMMKDKLHTEEDFFRSKGIWRLKVNRVLFAAKKARALQLISLCHRDKLAGSEILTEAERKAILEKHGSDLDSEHDISFYHIVKYAHDSYNIAELHMDRARLNFMHEDETRELLQGEVTKDINLGETAHEEFKNSIADASWTKERIAECEQAYLKRKETIKKMADEIEKIEDNEEKKKKRDELKRFIANVNDYEIYKKMNKRFYLYGEPEKNADPLFRNRVVINGVPVFKKMSNEDMRYMLGCMSAGVFEETEKNQLLRELYKEINMDGLMKYKEKMYEHYDYVYKKYGFAFPSIEFMAEHYQEWGRDFSSLNFDGSLIQRISGFFDSNNPKDKVLDKMMKIYECLNGKFEQILKGYYRVGENGTYSPEEYYAQLNTLWSTEVRPLVEEFKMARAKVNF